jgi:hypothetical protein
MIPPMDGFRQTGWAKAAVLPECSPVSVLDDGHAKPAQFKLPRQQISAQKSTLSTFKWAVLLIAFAFAFATSLESFKLRSALERSTSRIEELESQLAMMSDQAAEDLSVMEELTRMAKGKVGMATRVRAAPASRDSDGNCAADGPWSRGASYKSKAPLTRALAYCARATTTAMVLVQGEVDVWEEKEDEDDEIIEVIHM